MLSLDKLRKSEPSLEELSDDELKKIRESLYELGKIALDDYISKAGSNIPNGLLSKIDKAPRI